MVDSAFPVARDTITLHGRVATGKGEAAGYTELDWVRRQVADRIGFEHVPGTLNLRLAELPDLRAWQQIQQLPGVPLEPEPGSCAARCYPARAAGAVPCAIIFPLVANYPAGVVELIAPVLLRHALGLQDGDLVTVLVQVGNQPPPYIRNS